MCRHPANTITVFIISHGNVPGMLETEMGDLLVMKCTNFTWAVYLKAARQVTRQNCEEISKRHKIEEADRQNQEEKCQHHVLDTHKQAKKNKII